MQPSTPDYELKVLNAVYEDKEQKIDPLFIPKSVCIRCKCVKQPSSTDVVLFVVGLPGAGKTRVLNVLCNLELHPSRAGPTSDLSNAMHVYAEINNDTRRNATLIDWDVNRPCGIDPKQAHLVLVVIDASVRATDTGIEELKVINAKFVSSAVPSPEDLGLAPKIFVFTKSSPTHDEESTRQYYQTKLDVPITHTNSIFVDLADVTYMNERGISFTLASVHHLLCFVRQAVE